MFLGETLRESAVNWHRCQSQFQTRESSLESDRPCAPRAYRNRRLAGAETKDKRGHIVGNATMRCKSRPQVWAFGDCASIPAPDGKPYPNLAQHALREPIPRWQELRPWIAWPVLVIVLFGIHHVS